MASVEVSCGRYRNRPRWTHHFPRSSTTLRLEPSGEIAPTPNPLSRRRWQNTAIRAKVRFSQARYPSEFISNKFRVYQRYICIPTAYKPGAHPTRFTVFAEAHESLHSAYSHVTYTNLNASSHTLFTSHSDCSVNLARSAGASSGSPSAPSGSSVMVS